MRFRPAHDDLAKTLSFGAIHLVLATSIGWLLTGTFVFGALLALIEPICNTIVCHQINKRMKTSAGRGQAVAKSAVIGAAHFTVAVLLAVALTGTFAAAWVYALIEPAANAVAHYFFERWWDRAPRQQTALLALRCDTGAP